MKSLNTKTIAVKCPNCNGNILKGEKGYFCSNKDNDGCNFSLKLNVFGHEIDENFLKTIIENKGSDFIDGITEEGDNIRFKFMLESGTFILQYDSDSIEICDCPKCKVSKVIIMKKVYKCANAKCDFFLWRKNNGIKYNLEDVKSLCSGEEIEKEQILSDKISSTVKVSLDLAENELIIRS